MPNDPDLLFLAQAVLRKNRDSTWDKRGTSAGQATKICPKAHNPLGEVKALQIVAITYLSQCPVP